MSGLPPELVVAFLLADLVLIVLTARLVGALARRVGQPTIVGEIVAGILLGPTVLGPTLAAWPRPWRFLRCEEALAAAASSVPPSVTACLFPPQVRPALSIIGQIALTLFMFLVGLDFDADRLRGRARAVVGVTAAVVTAPVVGGLLMGPLLYDGGLVPGGGTPSQPPLLAFQLVIAALLAVTAFPVMAHILREKGMSDGVVGSVALAAAAAVTVLMFLLVAAASAVASGGLLPLALRIGWVTLYLAVMWLGVRPMLARVGPRLEATQQLGGTAFALLCCLALASALVTHSLGVSVIVGGFVVGLVLPARAVLRAALRSRLEDLTVVILLPVFLAYSGLNTDFTLLDAATLGSIALLLVGAVAAKWAAGAVGGRIGGLSWSQSNLVGVLMNCRGLLPLVVALIALEQGLITPRLQLGAVVVALATTAMTGPLFDAFRARALVPSSPARAAAVAVEPEISGG